MNNLLDELKENSTILCNSLSDADIFKSFHTVQAPPKSQPPSFFNFSNLNAYHQSPRKNIDQVANSRGPTKTALEPTRFDSINTENQSSRGRTSEKKRTNPLSFLSFDEISPQKATSVRGAVDRKMGYTQTDSFLNYLNLFGALANEDPNCCSREYQYSQPDQSAEGLLSHILDCKSDDFECEQVNADRYLRENALEMFKTKSTRQSIRDILEINKETMDFGTQLPGRILEESFDIKNKSSQSFSIEIIINCANPELQQTQDYVYSVRGNYTYDYSERKQFIISPNSTANFKIAIKIPQTKLVNEIVGKVQIVADGLEGDLTVALKAKSIFPKIFSPKQLYSTAMKRNFINVAINKEKSQEKKITLKNESNVPVTLELGFYNIPDQNSSLECSVYPKALTIPANGTAAATILFKPSKNTNQNNNKGKSITQKILYGKAKDSCLVYSFSLRVETI